jgi:hypothetical protein
MSTNTWTNLLGGDWATASNWNPSGVPDGSTALAILPGAAQTYTVTIAGNESEIVNTVTLGDLIIGNAGPTLDIAGTLTFAGTGPSVAMLSGTIDIESGGLVQGQGALGNTFGSGVEIVNSGTMLANAGAGADLAVLIPFTNSGTLMANNGQLGVEGASFSNFSGTTLTGGSYIVQSSTAGTFNQIFFGGGFNADLVVDAANIVLDGNATEIQGIVGGTFHSIETQLETIASNGTLELLSGRGYTTSNALLDDGQLDLQGGTLATGGLAIGGTGTLDGFGILSGNIDDQGDIIANGGALYSPGAIAGTGTLTVMSGSSLILAGATPSSITNNGVIYDTSGVLDVNALSGAGTLVVQGGATLDVAVGISESIVFSGTSAGVVLGAPILYSGTVAGFGLGDTLTLNGLSANAATVVNSDTLAVISSGVTVDTVALAGNYTGATFSAMTVGGNAVITNTGGAPARDDMPFTISVTNAAGLSGSQVTAVVNILSAAALDWAQYVTGHAPLRIQLNINTSSNGGELASGGPGDVINTGSISNGNGKTIVEPNSIYTLVTGNYDPSSTITDEIAINLPASTATQSSFDLLTIFRHELAHGLGFIGLRNISTGALGTDATLFDINTLTTLNAGGTVTAANFVGTNAEAAYRTKLGTGPTPVPLTLLTNGEAYYHVANSSSDPLGQDLMSGTGLPPNTSRDISSVDLAMLQDVSLPVTAGIVCFARGTTIATPRGEVPVERLAVGDLVLTLSGNEVPIVWIGVGQVLVTRGCRTAATPVIVKKGALADNMPYRDLRVTKGHALYLDGVLIPVECLVNHRSILWDDHARELEIYHIELAKHDVLLANGAPAESYRDDGNRWLFRNASLSWNAAPQLPCAPILTGGVQVDEIWRQLLDRAGPRPGLPLTKEPDLHLVVDGERLDPTDRRHDVCVFSLPARPQSVRIRSRSASPQELGLARDPRLLGVAIRALELRRSGWRLSVPADDDRLTDGFHTFEAAGGIRWTDGDGGMPSALLDRALLPTMLLVRLGGWTRYLLEDERSQAA